MTDDRGQMAEDVRKRIACRGQGTEDRGQRTDYREQMIGDPRGNQDYGTENSMK